MSRIPDKPCIILDEQRRENDSKNFCHKKQGSGESKLGKYRPEIEALLANGATQGMKKIKGGYTFLYNPL